MAANAFKEHEEAKIQQLLADAACAPTRANIKPQKPKAFLYETRRRYDEREAAILNEAQKIVECEDHKWLIAHKVLKQLRDAGHIDAETGKLKDPGTAFDWLEDKNLLAPRRRKDFFISDAKDSSNFADGAISPSQFIAAYIDPENEQAAREELTVITARTIQRVVDLKQMPPIGFNDDGNISRLGERFQEPYIHRFYKSEFATAPIWRWLNRAFEELQGTSKRRLTDKNKQRIWEACCEIKPYIKLYLNPFNDYQSHPFTVRASAADPSGVIISRVYTHWDNIENTLWALCHDELDGCKGDHRLTCGRLALGWLVYLLAEMYNGVGLKEGRDDKYTKLRIAILFLKQTFERHFPGIPVVRNGRNHWTVESFEDSKVAGYEFRRFLLDVFQAVNEICGEPFDREAMKSEVISAWRSDESLENQIPAALKLHLGLDGGEPCPYGSRGFFNGVPYLRVAQSVNHQRRYVSALCIVNR